jgi:hypothetical protein
VAAGVATQLTVVDQRGQGQRAGAGGGKPPPAPGGQPAALGQRADALQAPGVWRGVDRELVLAEPQAAGAVALQTPARPVAEGGPVAQLDEQAGQSDEGLASRGHHPLVALSVESDRAGA